MSLLLDALKKAEQAKQKAITPAGAEEKQASASSPPVPFATDSGIHVAEPAVLAFTLEEPASRPEMPEQTFTAKNAAAPEGAQETLAFPDLTLDLAVHEPEPPAITGSNSPSTVSTPAESANSAGAIGMPPARSSSEPAPLPIDGILPLNEARHNSLELSLDTSPQGASERPTEIRPEKKEETVISVAEASPSIAAPPAAQATSQPEVIAPAMPAYSSPSPKTDGSGKAAAKRAAQQKTAKNVFSAKLPRPKISPKLLMAVLATGVLSVAGLGFYYWTLLSEPQPQPFRRTHPLPPLQVAAPTPVATLAANNVAATKPAETPPQADVSAPKAAENPSRPAEASPTPAQVASEPAQAFSAPVDSPIKIRRITHSDRVNPVLLDAYQAYMTGDTSRAEKGYRQMLQLDPRNRDALLGLAAIATSQQRSEDAAAYYTQLLELDPKDPEAQTGLINLKGSSDPTKNESRLKTLLTQYPETGSLHFALGNLYAQQSRWPEAQGAYFKAFSTEPKNADYAFNLAISLDHLNQGQLALKYYQQALTLAGSRPAGFDKTQVSDRIQILSQ